MSNSIDLTGQKFGKLTVVSRAENSKNSHARWLCACDCGGRITVFASNLKDGSVKRCGHKLCTPISFIDLSGQKFGKLLVISRAEKRGSKNYWLCHCGCGNNFEADSYHIRKGVTVSCSLCAKRITTDLTGQRFGKLTVISRDDSRRYSTHWNCACDCGKNTIVYGGSLKSGNSKSCGCLERKHQNLIGQKFGRLTVLSRADNVNKKINWNCICDCGNSRVIPTTRLKNGSSKSCGCLRLEDLTGKKIGNLTVLSYAEGKWVCQCDCGNVIRTSAQSLKKNNKNSLKSCGCLPKYNKLSDKTLAAKRLLFSSYQKGAKRRGHSFQLSFDEFINIVQQDCFYCGVGPLQCCKNKHSENFYYNGIDRVDNGKGYSMENVKTCCFLCNRAKRDRGVEEFIAWVKKCYNNMNLNNK